MLDFPETYFQEETRMGFTISQTMKRAWAAQLEVLQKIIRICKKHNIRYYALWGTLLGAVRHGGFIPWDDDIDIAMKRDDYTRFLQVAKKELPAEYCLLNIYTDVEWPHFCARVTNSRDISTAPERLSRYHGCPFAVGVDIFQMDYLPRDEGEARLQRELLGIIRDVLPLLDDGQGGKDKTAEELQESRETAEEGICALEEYCKVSIDRGKNVRNQLLRLYDRICAIYGEKDSDILTSYPEYIKGEGIFLPKEWFGVRQMQFENITIAVPSEYDKILTALYGDYMTPVRDGQEHEYPFYKEQLQALHESGVWLDVDV